MATLPRLMTAGIELDTSESAFGWLTDSNELLGQPEALRDRMERDGYLFLPGFFDREEVIGVRRGICEVLAAEGLLDQTEPVECAIARANVHMYFRADIANSSPARAALKALIYGDRIMAFYAELLGGAARHYDFTWLRTVSPGLGTSPHCDVVYMGRGTHNLYTAWVPLGDVPLEVGGLVLVEGSHKDEELRAGYCQMDVDTACENHRGESQTNVNGYPGFGVLSPDLRATRTKLGGRLLTCPNYRMGDLLTFSVFTVHGSLDNGSREIRLSSDSRYQLASEPVDPRWVGEEPPGHGGESVLSMIC